MGDPVVRSRSGRVDLLPECPGKATLVPPDDAVRDECMSVEVAAYVEAGALGGGYEVPGDP